MLQVLEKNRLFINKLRFAESRAVDSLISDAFVQKLTFPVGLVTRSWANAIITTGLFFRYRKILRFRKNLKKLRGVNSEPVKGLPFFRNFKNFIPAISICLIVNLNRKTRRFIAADYFRTFRKFSGRLFIRRRGLFSDFLNFSSLFLLGKVKVADYLKLLSQIFIHILKHRHNLFFTFITVLFDKIIQQSFVKGGRLKAKISILGIKLKIRGRLRGKPRKAGVRILFGHMPLHTVSKNISFSKRTVYNRYGGFGFKMWVHDKTKNKCGLLLKSARKSTQSGAACQTPFDIFQRQNKLAYKKKITTTI